MLIEIPRPDGVVYPTLGPQVCDFIEEKFCYGPGSLQGQKVTLDVDQRRVLYHAYEHFPEDARLFGMTMAGRRRFQRVAMSVRKGSAKCLDHDTILTTEDGRRVRAADLRVGDRVLSHRDGKPIFCRVAAVQEQPIAARYRVETMNGRSITTSIGHPFLVAGTQWREGMPKRWKYTSCDPAAGSVEWSDVQDLAAGDRVVVGLDWAPEGGDTDLGWMLGVLVGDGSGDGRFSNADLEISERVSRHFEMTTLTHPQEGQYYLRGSRGFLREHDLWGKNAYTKTTPAAVMQGGRDTILGYLAGLLDTDGSTIDREISESKRTRTVEWYSVSRSLMEDVQHLLAAVGVNGTLRHKMSKYQGLSYVSWTVVVSDVKQVRELARVLPCIRVRNTENFKTFRDLPDDRTFADVALDKVRSVTRIADGQTIGVEIEDTHVHVTNGMVTHNTELLAWVVACELHPEGPVRWTGYSQQADGGLKTGRPVNDPYIPMLAYTKDQVSELGYGALVSILESCDDADLFDIGLGRVIRLNPFGRPDGKVVPVAGSPSAADGARTTMQALDETHRLYTDIHRDAIETMLNNLPKRPMEDPWQFSTTTAGEPGQNSYAEDEYKEGMENWERKVLSNGFYFFHRQASDGCKFNTMEQRMEAIWEATGPGVRKWSRVDTIAANWDRKGADKAYLERVWTNRWSQTAAQVFDRDAFEGLGNPRRQIKKGSFVTLGFDGARFSDALAIVMTEIKTGIQNLVGFWEKPSDWDEKGDRDENGKLIKWQVPESEVRETFKNCMSDYEVWRAYCDPPHWVETVADWAGIWPDQVIEFWTKDPTRMYYAIKDFRTAIETGALSHNADPDYTRHIGNAGKRPTRGVDEDDQPKFILAKISQERKYDAAVAGILSWKARADALTENAQPADKAEMPRRVR